jgi:Flp pilus assembly protein TadD
LEAGDLNRAADLWAAARTEAPGYLPATEGLAEVALARRDWAEAERWAAELDRLVPGGGSAAAVRARAFTERGEFGAARAVLEQAIRTRPTDGRLRSLFSHTLLMEGTDPTAAEAAIRDVLRLDPANAEAAHNLAVLLAGGGRPVRSTAGDRL